jgi:hypothetical protein
LVNADEVVVDKNSLSPDWLREKDKNIKKKAVKEPYLEILKEMQFKLIYKRRQDELKKNRRIPWHSGAHL